MMDELLKERASKLWGVLEQRNKDEPIMKEAVEIIGPMIALALSTQIGLPDKLPSFFGGMHDWEFSAHYLGDTELLNALGDFEDSLKNHH